jgi:crotonobetainyl-CoA:carnitine CoA-transferase CaiB-like acyl-CoA transferase
MVRERTRLRFLADGLVALAGMALGIAVLPRVAEAQTPLYDSYCGHDNWIEFRRNGRLYRAYYVSRRHPENDVRHIHRYQVYKRSDGRWVFVGTETHRC